MSDDQALIAQFRPVALLDRGIKSVAIDMGNGEIAKLGMSHEPLTAALRTDPGARLDQPAAIAAESWAHCWTAS